MKRLLLLFIFAAGPLFAADQPRAVTDFFEKEVRPILANRCYECHGEKKKKGSLRMDDITLIKQGGDSGPALVPGNPEKSIMIDAIKRKDPDFAMPPKEAMPEKEIAILERWVKMGAPWPESGPRVTLDENGFSPEAKAFWSFQPLTDPKVPAVASKWVRGDIDRFIAAKHQELGLQPAPEADRRELVRRLYFDVHGLPPTPHEAEAFVKSTDPQAYEKLVDSLLASPRYGERWAQHWLDLVRYAESDGYNQDAYRAAAYPYRDWVINALNNDLPYNEFARQQIAGDELKPNDPNVIVATGYLRNPIYEYNQRDVRGQWDLIVNDMTDNASEVFLGLSYGCARCHDHKFDPILQKDYFRLKAFFAPVFWRDDLKLGTDEQKAEFDVKQAEWEKVTADIRAQLDAFTAKAKDSASKKAYGRFTEDLQAMIDKPFAERTALERQLAGICLRQMVGGEDKVDPKKSLKGDDKTRYEELEEQLKAFDNLKPKPLLPAFVATDAGDKAPPTTFKTRKGESEVQPGFLTLLAPGDAQLAPKPGTTGRRTALANWIARPDNQLTTRVIVNRVWEYHFGHGLVGTANDLGKLGEKPSHPELLDWLARRFVANGWSLKKLHRDILLSATYRQTAHIPVPELAVKIDPANKFLWRFSPRRLEAEQVRDAMLAASGELNTNAGGPSEDGNGTRRSIYTMKKRNSQMELLHALDAPAGFESTPDRQSTTTPTQALLLLNGDWALQRAQKLAEKVSTVDQAFLATLGRPPTPQEAETANRFLKKTATLPAAAPATPLPATPPPSALPVKLENPALFHENTPQERLTARTTGVEGDEFTIEAIVQLNSVDPKTAVRTIASRWNGTKDSVEGFGWSLGVTGDKSRFKPNNLIIQLVGEDENENITYEVVASDLRIELGKRYHVAVQVSCSSHTVNFRVEDLSAPGTPALTATKPQPVKAKLATGPSGITLGGLQKRAPMHQWDGTIESLRIATGILPETALVAEAAKWKQGLVNWNAKDGPGKDFEQSGGDAATSVAKAGPSAKSPMVDLCHVLLNANEFFYLH